ncbi:DUF3466 family protein [Thalassotalea crassostreae]|uniref:DUF3466 family protein n=1 Tax=Thalassotalea crassostreae TaxID=1763536 RepID=UPI00083801E6|nr:DUF3466 family protein [Thalassotalea crassostreae]
MRSLIKTTLALSITATLLSPSANAATYSVQDLGLIDKVKHIYGIEYNNLGQVVLSGNTTYNFPVQFENLDLDEDNYDDIINFSERYDESYFYLEEIKGDQKDMLRAGQPDANALEWTKLWLTTRNTEYQQVGDAQVYLFDGQTTEEFIVYDQVIPGTDQLTRSVRDLPKGITDDGWIYGSSPAPAMPLEPFVDDEGDTYVHWIREFNQRAWVSINGAPVVSIMPPEATYGGLSAINDLSNGIAVGSASFEMNPEILKEITDEDEECYKQTGDGDPDDPGNMPLEACISIFRANLYNAQAYKWTLDASGNVIDTEVLGTGIVNQDKDDERVFRSEAVSINSSGIAVGMSHFWWDEDETTPSENERVGLFAAIFADGKVYDFTDRDDWSQSRAVKISDQGIMIGLAYSRTIYPYPSKFYYVDVNKTPFEPIYPDDFFNSSNSEPFDINNNGKIVGRGEHNTDSNPRRHHGFVYDIETDVFADVNDLLSCEDQLAYTIIEARSINDSDQILGTAWYTETRRDSKGELIYDENGEPVIENVLRAVYLDPIAEGEIEDCGEELEENVERKGASFGLLGIFAFMVAGWRRRLS